MKVNITVDDDLMKRIDDYASKNYMSRSGLMSLACTRFLNEYEMVHAIQDMALTMRKIADVGQVDEETQKKLEDFERLSKFFCSEN